MPEHPASTPEQWQLSVLNQSIDRLQSEIDELEGEQTRLVKAARRARRCTTRLRLAAMLRAPSASWEMWPVGVLAVGPLVAGIALLVVVDLLTGSLAAAVLGFFVGAGLGALALSMLLFRPANSVLPAEMCAAVAARELSESQSRDAAERLTASRARLRDLTEERRELVASGKVQRAALLQREWKTMPGAEWEDFIVEVCRTIGATVERLPRSQGSAAYLLADFGDRRVLIVTTGEGHVVNSSAVQTALAGQKQFGAPRCAVIINRRFTGAAQDFARHNVCTLVGLEEFPDFVMGKLRL